LGVRFGKGAVRFEEAEAEEVGGEEEVGQIVVIPPEMDKEPEPEKVCRRKLLGVWRRSGWKK
jgi:hypothetical protein